MTDRYLDLLKQGFMKPHKTKMVTLFQHWLPNGEGLSYEGQSEMTAITQKQQWGGEIKTVRRPA